MPPLETIGAVQRAVLWPADGYDDYGQAVVSVSQRKEICVRWINRKREVLDANGNTIAVDATITDLDRSIPIGSIVWLGCLKDLPSDKIPETDILTVKTYDETPDLKGRNYRREATLMRHTDTLPVE